jgi:hypothetical protein
MRAIKKKTVEEKRPQIDGLKHRNPPMSSRNPQSTV